MLKHLLIVVALVWATVALAAQPCAYTRQRPQWCQVEYWNAGTYTKVYLRCGCNDGTSSKWFVSYFDDYDAALGWLDGPTPTLWDWWEIQNAATELIKQD